LDFSRTATGRQKVQFLACLLAVDGQAAKTAWRVVGGVTSWFSVEPSYV